MRRSLLLLPLALGWAPGLAAQQDTTKIPTGVRLEVVYQTAGRPKLGVRPLSAAPALVPAAEQVRSIIRRDLDYSDRFIMGELPASQQVDAIQYGALDDLGFVWLVAGSLEPGAGGGHRLTLELHDVVYGRVKESGTFTLPPAGSPDFRMAVHAAADEVVRWATGEPGMAASRIAFVRRGANGVDLLVVDSDGENLERITGGDRMLYSPVWSPDGGRIAYAVSQPSGAQQLLERDLRSGETRVISNRPGLNFTPAYAPDGRRLAFATTSGSGTEIFEYDVARRCCLERLSRSPRDDLSPTYAPDGRRIAFNSNRLGQPHIFVMPASGGEAVLLSPYVHGEPGYYTSPDWSPLDTKVAFHGRSRGEFQIMLADAARPGATVVQLTTGGRSEDPSWAPDGRHLVFAGVRPEGSGLFVIDTKTGRMRPLILGGRYMLPDWSAPLLKASALAARGFQPAPDPRKEMR